MQGCVTHWRVAHKLSKTKTKGPMKFKWPVATALLALTTLAHAQMSTPSFQYRPGAANFSGKEWTADVFGLWASRDRESLSGDNTAGFGLGGNYFYNTYLGFGAETYIDEFDYPNHLDGSVILRYPIQKWNLAPYVFGGFGRQFHDVSQWTSHVGAGVDFRFNDRTGLFSDVRAIFPDRSRDLALWRFGVRFRF